MLAALVAPAFAKTRKGDQFLKEGRQAEVRKEYEKALELYEKAMLEDPADPAYQIAAKRVRFQAGMTRVDLGQKLRKEGKLQEALDQFQKAYAIDPASGIAMQEIQSTRKMIEREKNAPPSAANDQDKGLTSGERAEKESEERVSRMLPVPELKPIDPTIRSLKMNNQPVRVLYETVGKLAGINVILDPDMPTTGGANGGRFTIDLSNTTLEQALDTLGVVTKTFWKPLSSNTIFVTQDNVTKRRDYEDFVVKVFYIKNATTVQELQEIATSVRSIAEIRRAFTYNSMNAILVRDTADKVALAEKLIRDLDKPRPEVVIDVVVLQANRAKVRDLGAYLTTAGAAGINLPFVYAPGGVVPGSGTGTGTDAGTGDGTGTGNSNSGLVPLNGLKNINLFGDFATNIPGAVLQAVLTDSDTRVLQEPQLRAVEGEKASLKIGDRIPFASGSFTPLTGGVGAGITPYAQTQFQYADVGVNIDLTPKVHGRDEISMHVEVDISNVSNTVDIGGIKQPVISQRKVVHNIRIREGQVNLLGGLMSTEDIKNIAGIPLLMQIPVLKYLFGSDHTERRSGELLIALIPHIVRAPEFDDVNMRGISAGSDATVKLSYSPQPLPPASTSPAPTPGHVDGTASPKPVAAEQPATPESTPANSQNPAPAAETPGQISMSFSPGPVTTPVNQPFTLSLQMSNAADVFSAPMRIKFDPKVLRLTSVQQGNFMSQDGQRVTFNENTLNEQGEAIISINRLPGAGGIGGTGPLVNLTFQPVAPGTTNVQVSEVTVRNSQLQQINVAPPSVAVTVQ